MGKYCHTPMPVCYLCFVCIVASWTVHIFFKKNWDGIFSFSEHTTSAWWGYAAESA